MQEHPELFSEAAINGVREFLLTEERLDPEMKDLILTETDKYRATRPEQEETVRNEMADVNHCLENVHLYDGQEDNAVCGGDELEAEKCYRDALAQYSKPILPYHERDDGANERCESAFKKSVSFENDLK